MLVALMLGALQSPDLLELGPTGTRNVSIGSIVRTSDGRSVSTSQVAAALDGERWFYLGENHATAEHQKLEADMVQALVDRGRRVVVGVEFFQRPKQSVLDQWSAGSLTEDEFLTKADWKGQWGYPYPMYRSLFEVIRKNRVPLVGLNVPRDWVRAVGRGGRGP